MPQLDRSNFKYNAKVFEKTCLWCGTIYFASRSTAKYCSATCRGYANQAKAAEQAVPYDETEKMISALLSENAYLKGQLQRYVTDNETLRKELERFQSNGN
ncbi:hypothetical protein FHS57_005878 [Runella defluvii]|jgi:hypothetical protein|uniref:Uncharacterized protein n=1 Tax=Runella defluvii TaxID=370973 RepID=A0A7W5ZU80_9BACT|nr:hypothetical protein [Runella defluvii]MBB3841849.1 hypothetical protein [Runella defluvii]